MKYFLKVIALISIGLFVQATSPDCKETVRSYIRGLASIKESSSKAYCMHYETLNYGKDNAEVKAFVKMILKGNSLVYESDYISIYQDDKEVYTLVHPQKVIVKSKPNSAKIKEMRMKKGGVLQDSVFKVSTLKSCTDGFLNSSPVRITELALTEQGSKTFKVTKIVYYFNEKENRLDKQELYYIPGAKIVKQEILFKEMSFDYKGKIKSHARDYLYNGSKLDSRYKDYKFQ
jgi:hypothetical protein